MIHSLADVQTDKVGDRTQIWQFVVVLPGARIGCNCNINCNCFVENDVTIGNNVTVKSGTYIWDGVTIEDNVFIGPCVAFTNDMYPRSKVYPKQFAKTLVRRNASIGANSTIVGGVTIGEFALIGAGSVVTRSVPSYALVYGNPAKVHGYICECGNKLDNELVCGRCQCRYVNINGMIVKKE